MKMVAASLPDDELLARVVSAIREISGHRLDKIGRESRLLEDLGIYGDDGHALFEALHEQFEMDWTGLDLRVHFGTEGLGAPLPWQVAESPAYFEHQPVTVAELTQALRNGRWPQSALIPAPAKQRRMLRRASWVQFGLLGGSVLVVLVCAVMAGLGS